MPIEDDEYVPRTDDEVFESSAENLRSINPETNPRSPSTYTYALLLGIARTLAQNQEQDLKEVYESAYIEDASEANLTKKARNLGFVRREAVAATGVVEFSRESAATDDYVIPAGTVVETLSEDPISFETVESVTLSQGDTSVFATVEATEVGTEGNVGPNAIATMPSPPSGVGTVTNPEATGDTSLTDTNGQPLVQGKDRETDASLRQRVLTTDSTDEGPSPAGIQLALEQTEGVLSVDVNTNQSPQTTADGLEPYNTEIVAYGGAIETIAEKLAGTMSMTAFLRLQGGVHGTKEETILTVRLLDEDVVVPISRPNLTQLSLELDVVHDDTYAGDDAVKDTIVSYIGGTYLDDTTFQPGTEIGEDVRVNRVESEIESVQGVLYADVTLLDADGDGTDDTSTTNSGVPVYAVDDSSLARIDADDVTVTTTLE